ncbi:MAG TPA: hypothetical protein VEA41_03430 [Salinarimonas sp.]|nr:hypothetical protein [Salinarimonas sp.]
MIEPESFGAAGDGRRDDTAALQAAFDRAENGGVRLRAATYRVSDTLLLPTNTILDGGGAVIQSSGADRPILASAAWAGRGGTRGRTRIERLRLHGTGRGERQDGLVLHDFWSEIDRVEVVDTGGRGIVLVDEDRSGRRPSSTLVENRIRDCVVRDARRAAFWLGPRAGGKLTDGELVGCIASLARGASEPAVFIGHAAGWIVDRLHLYGGAPRTACEIHQPYFASLSNLYIEAFAEVGLGLHGVQTSVSVTNVHIVAQEARDGGAFIATDRHRDFADPVLTLSNIALWNVEPRRLQALRADPGVRVRPLNVALGGKGVAAIDRAGLDASAPAAAPSPRPDPRRAVQWSGAGAKIVEIAGEPDGAPFSHALAIAITGRGADGALASAFTGVLHWGRLAPDGPAPASLVPTGPSQGFQRPPEAVVERRGGAMVLSLVFAPAAPGMGMVSIG